MPLDEETKAEVTALIGSQLAEVSKSSTEALNLAVKLKKDLGEVASKEDLSKLTDSIGTIQTGLESLTKGGAGGGKPPDEKSNILTFTEPTA